MTRVSTRIAALMAVLVPSFAAAQETTQSARLQRAIEHYQNFAVEKALRVLDTVLSNPAGLSDQQLATAYKYAGAGHAVLDRKTASIRFFREAIKRDTSVGLEPSKFGQDEVAQFRLARLSLLQGRPDSEFTDRREAEAPYVPPPTEGFAEIRIGSPTANAFFYVNNELQGPITTVAFWKVPAGKEIKIAIRSPQCTGQWDTTFTLPVGARWTIGRRLLRCSP